MHEYEEEDIDHVGTQEEESGMGGIEWYRLYLSVKKSILWALLFLFTSITICYYYLKYTKPVYRAASLIKLDVQSEASDIGLGGSLFKKLDNLSGEIELIKSPLVAEEVLNRLDLNVSYYAVGNILTTELFGSNPFIVEFNKTSETILYDQVFIVEFKNPQQFYVYPEKSKEKEKELFQIHQNINIQGFEFKIKPNPQYTNIGNQKEYQFVVNSPYSNISYLLNNVDVQVVNQDARTLSIAFADHNREKAKAIVNAFDTVYLKQSLNKKQQSQEQTLDFIATQLESTSKRLDTAEHELMMFMRENKTTSEGSGFSEMFERIMAFEEEKTQLNKKKEQLARVQFFAESESPQDNIIPLVFGIENAQISSAINTLNDLYKQKQILKISIKENTTPYKKLELEINLVKTQLLEYLKESFSQLNEQLASINKHETELKNSFDNLPTIQIELKRLSRYSDLYEKYYLSLLDKQIQFQILKAGTVPEFTILSAARSPSDPIHPEPNKIWLLFIVGGIAPGALMIAIRYLLMNIVLDPKDAEKRITPPLLGLIPAYKKKLDASTLVVDQNPKSAISEAFRSLRSNANFMLENKPSHLIGVTSTVSGEGKTMFAINFAAIQAFSGKKVIILDFDMRKAKIHVGFNVPNNAGISTILVGQSKWQDVVHKTRLANLDFITAGPTPPNPSELILRKEFDELLFNLFEEYDIVMIDTPPIGLVTDASTILSKTDLSVYVIRAGYSHKNNILNVNSLYKSKKIKNLSVAINDVTVNTGYGYGYGYYEEDRKTQKGWKKWFKR